MPRNPGPFPFARKRCGGEVGPRGIWGRSNELVRTYPVNRPSVYFQRCRSGTFQETYPKTSQDLPRRTRLEVRKLVVCPRKRHSDGTEGQKPTICPRNRHFLGTEGPTDTKKDRLGGRSFVGIMGCYLSLPLK